MEATEGAFMGQKTNRVLGDRPLPGILPVPVLGRREVLSCGLAMADPSMGKGEFTGRLQVTGKDNKLI